MLLSLGAGYSQCYVNHWATLALCCSGAICRDRKGKTNVWRATNMGLVREKLQTLFLLCAAHSRKINATSQVWLWKGEDSGLQLFSSAGLQHTLRSNYTLSIAFKTWNVRASLVPIMNSWEQISPCFPPSDLQCDLGEIYFYYFDQTNLSFLKSFCISANQLANLWRDGTDGQHPSREFWGHGHLCWKPA